LEEVKQLLEEVKQLLEEVKVPLEEVRLPHLGRLSQSRRLLNVQGVTVGAAI
jgi:hypothetical protein